MTKRDVQANPYSDPPERAVWRRAVTDRHPLSLAGLYRKKFDISVEDRIVTAGSCFAQHIARKLREQKYNFMNYEPAPPYFPDAKLSSYNYGVYSARYCNIYTTRQLLQTFDRAFGEFTPAESMWASDKGVYDAFRPLVEPAPFSTEAECEAARKSHLRSVRKVFRKSDLFIFTLGLTEGWVSKEDGAVYPMCPGTVAGTFDDKKYEFKNFTFNEIYSDLKIFIQKMRAKNPAVKFLFTVSPVPLTATASDNHVLVATMHSKSILRAVAGQLASEDDGVDYFPSYEVIASPSMRGMFYESNMRTVGSPGVDYVMSFFFDQHKSEAASDPVALNPVKKKRRRVLSADDAVCEEMMLDRVA